MKKILVLFSAALLMRVPVFAGINDWMTGEYANAGITTYYIEASGASPLMMSPIPGRLLNFAPSDGQMVITAASVKLKGVGVGESNIRVWKKEPLDCTFAITNNSASERTAVIAIAIYSEENYLCGFDTVNVILEGGEGENVRIIYTFPENAYRGKIMFWDSLSGMMPLRTEISFSETNGVNAYCYDLDNRLLQIDKANGVSIAYDYDNMGNLLSRRVNEND